MNDIVDSKFVVSVSVSSSVLNRFGSFQKNETYEINKILFKVNPRINIKICYFPLDYQNMIPVTDKKNQIIGILQDKETFILITNIWCLTDIEFAMDRIQISRPTTMTYCIENDMVIILDKHKFEEQGAMNLQQDLKAHFPGLMFKMCTQEINYYCGTWNNVIFILVHEPTLYHVSKYNMRITFPYNLVIPAALGVGSPYSVNKTLNQICSLQYLNEFKIPTFLPSTSNLEDCKRTLFNWWKITTEPTFECTTFNSYQNKILCNS